MARILILTLVFPPDSVSTARLFADVARDLQRRGHVVTVLTTRPHYNRDPEAEARQPLRRYWGPLLQVSDLDGVRVFHTAMPRKGASIPLRLLAWLQFHIISTVAGVGVVPRPDVILAPSPPLTIGLGAWLLGRYHRAPYVYNVNEIYPDIAISLGVIRQRWLIRLLYGLERFVYDRAAKVTVIARRMRERLLEKGVPDERIALIPNHVDLDAMHRVPKENEFSRAFGIAQAFVVSYAGNLGPAQGLDTFLEAARLLRDEPDIRLLLIGDGISREALARTIEREQLTNVHLIPFQPASRMPAIYGASDLCLVPLAAAAGADAVPSKVLQILACQRPVLAVTERESDLAQIVRDANCGFVVPPGSPTMLAETIREAFRARATLDAMGAGGRAYVKTRFARDVVADQFNSLIEELTCARS